MTGLRVGELLAILREDLYLDRGQLVMRWDDTKADRDEVVPLHPVVVEHLRLVVRDAPLVFRWGHEIPAPSRRSSPASSGRPAST